jgi:hypothetical protein
VITGENDSEGGIAGLSLGIGGWINPNTAITLRIAGVTIFPEEGITATSFFVGPSVQMFVAPKIWIGGGAGIAAARVADNSGNSEILEKALGLDLRAGFLVMESGVHSLSVSAEITPAFYENSTITGFGALLNYQLM